MKKITSFIIIAASIASISAFAQTGINTTMPAATLEVKAKNPTGTSTGVDGILIPRVSRQRARNMTNIPESTLIYVDNLNGGATGVVRNIIVNGYYYYNGSVWLGVGQNIYTADGKLTGDRTIDGDGIWTLSFKNSWNGANAFSVFTNGKTLPALSVHGGTGNVGLNTSSPVSLLHVNGVAQFVNGISLGGTAGLQGNQGTVGQVLTSGGAGVATSWTTPAASTNIYNTSSSLTSARTVTQAGFPLAFVGGTTTNAFAVDGTSFSVDALNHRVGLGTATPLKTLHVNGTTQLTNELNVGGSATTAGSAGTTGQYLVSKGAGVAPAWESPAGLVPTSNGSVIAVNGKLIVAQEITAQMTADFNYTAPGAQPIGNLGLEIIDNENQYTANATTNSFKVTTDGVYQVIMLTQLITTSGAPVIGLWDDTQNRWVARNNSGTGTNGSPQTYTIITSIPMLAANTYSFRIANTDSSTIKQLNAGGTGSGPITQVSVKRLK